MNLNWINVSRFLLKWGQGWEKYAKETYWQTLETDILKIEINSKGLFKVMKFSEKGLAKKGSNTFLQNENISSFHSFAAGSLS